MISFKIFNYPIFPLLLVLFSVCESSANVSGSTFYGLNGSGSANAVRTVDFVSALLNESFGRRRSQASAGRRQLKCNRRLADVNFLKSSDKSLHHSLIFRLKEVSNCVWSYSQQICLTIAENYEIASLLFTLLVTQGVEPNPGPVRQSQPKSPLSLISQNCRGLTDRRKAIKLIRQLQLNRHSKIACLQETHVIDPFISSVTDATVIVDNGERNSKGTAIVLSSQFEVTHRKVSGTGRWSMVACIHRPSQSKLIVTSVYAPNDHSEAISFFRDLFESLDEFCYDSNIDIATQIVLAGDFNFVHNPDLFSINRKSTRAEAVVAEYVIGQLDDRGFKDSVELLHEDCCSYTWRRGICASRLDYIFTTAGMYNRTTNCKTEWHKFGSSYDHAAVSIEFDLSLHPRGRSYMKLFESDIAKPSDKEWLRGQLQQAELQCLPTWNPQMKYEFLKMTLRSKTLELRQMNKVACSSEVIKANLNSVIQRSPQNQAEINELKIKLLEAEEAEQKILALKAGIKWREAGERSSKYFLSKFKANQEMSEIRSLRESNGTEHSTISALLEYVRQFYSGLYSNSNPNPIDLDDSFFDLCPSMDPVQARELAKPLSVEELKDSLATCKESAPGLDGIPYSFYKSFGNILLPALLESWEHSKLVGSLNMSHRRSCITLLPKRGKDLENIGNWRPISLSPCDLKIITKAFANRLKRVLPDLLHEAQAAYIPGRDISFNNRLISLAKLHCNRTTSDYCIVSLDARKAFDSVSHSYLNTVLRIYGFPREFIESFNLLYKDNESVVQVNGHLSSSFSIKRGVKQGDALSCGLFVIAMDPLIRNLAENVDIEGLSVPISRNESIELKVLAYADDVTIVCSNRNLQPIFTEYERLSKISGLVLNANKTEVLNFIPSPVVNSNVTYLEQAFTIGRVDRIKICGIWITLDLDLEYELNVKDKIKIMENIITSWKRRIVSLNGRMILAKVFILSQIVYVAQTCVIRTKEIKKIEWLIYSYVNGSKSLYGPERIARKYLKAPKDKGGIAGIDVDSFITSLMLRQYAKANISSRSLRATQQSMYTVGDSIGNAAEVWLRTHYRKELSNLQLIPDIDLSLKISGIPLKYLINTKHRAWNGVREAELDNLYAVQQSYANGILSRTNYGAIANAIPTICATLLRTSQILDSGMNLIIKDGSDYHDLSGIKSNVLKMVLTNIKLGPLSVDIPAIHKDPNLQQPSSLHHVWRIKNPTLRNSRLKLLYKDVFCNARRFNFRITQSPNCFRCVTPETVVHQLIECPNAVRLWQIHHSLTGINPPMLIELISPTKHVAREITKSIIIKRLLQIDRSANVTQAELKLELMHYLRTEANVNEKAKTECLSMVERINNV